MCWILCHFNWTKKPVIVSRNCCCVKCQCSQSIPSKTLMWSHPWSATYVNLLKRKKDLKSVSTKGRFLQLKIRIEWSQLLAQYNVSLYPHLIKILEIILSAQTRLFLHNQTHHHFFSLTLQLELTSSQITRKAPEKWIELVKQRDLWLWFCVYWNQQTTQLSWLLQWIGFDIELELF